MDENAKQRLSSFFLIVLVSFFILSGSLHIVGDQLIWGITELIAATLMMTALTVRSLLKRINRLVIENSSLTHEKKRLYRQNENLAHLNHIFLTTHVLLTTAMIVDMESEDTAQRTAGKPEAETTDRTQRLVQINKILKTEIEERRRVEVQLKRLLTAIENAAEDIVITDTQGIIEYVNPAFEKITGYDRLEAIGQHASFFRSDKHDPAYYEKMWTTIRDGNVWAGQIINRRKDGKLIEQDANISPIIDSAGKQIGFVIIKRDVTEQVKIESQLRQAQKMEAIGTLAGGIAHDFNNILSGIMGYSELALMNLPDTEKVTTDIKKVIAAATRAKDLVRQILTFSRQREVERKPVKVKLIIKEVLRFIRASLPSTILIEHDINSDSNVLADPTQIHQVIMNLCTNAGYAMRENGGALYVSLHDMSIDNQAALPHPDLSTGKYVQLTVRDTGYGIAPDIVNRIFDPFFTTKKLGEGTGMGLSVVHGIVKSYNGSIVVKSQPNVGSTFSIFLPVIEEVYHMTKDSAPDLPRGTETILFVDDEDLMVDIAKQMFEWLGYTVFTFTDSLAAIEAFKRDPQKFDLIISDMTMPHLTGDKLAAKLLHIRPGIPIIITTGFSENITEEDLKSLGVKQLVMKPLVLDEIAQTIRMLLDENKPEHRNRP